MIQPLHYGQENGSAYFKLSNTGFQISADANFSSITVPMSLHTTTFTNREDSYISRIKSIKLVQVVNDTEINEYDFVRSFRAAETVYSEILKFFASIQFE